MLPLLVDYTPASLLQHGNRRTSQVPIKTFLITVGCSHLRPALYTLRLWKLITVCSTHKQQCVRDLKQTHDAVSPICHGLRLLFSLQHIKQRCQEVKDNIAIVSSLRDADVIFYGTSLMMSQMQS